MKPLLSYIQPATTAKLTFKGFFLPDEIDQIPKVRGIYAAYACEEIGGRLYGSLVYIGKADRGNNIRNRIESHIDGKNEAPSGKQSEWIRKYCRGNKQIRYAYATYGRYLHDIESALIFKNQPKANDHHKERYNGRIHPLCIICTGDIGTLAEKITV